jgi:hypothetical protein
MDNALDLLDSLFSLYFAYSSPLFHEETGAQSAARLRLRLSDFTPFLLTSPTLAQ